MAALGPRQPYLFTRVQRTFAHYKCKAACAVVAVCAGVTMLAAHEGQFSLTAIADTAGLSVSGVSRIAGAANKKAIGKALTLCFACDLDTKD